jgi:excisionase family DNA binding protein
VTTRGRLPAEATLLTIEEVRDHLRISRSLAYKLCEEGTLPSIRVASAGSRRGRLLVHRDDLDRYVARLWGEAGARPTRVDVDAIRDRVRRRHG